MDNTSNLFGIDNNDIILETGRILIAEPFLEGRYFKRAVIILSEYKDDGAVGFVLNKPSGVYVEDVIDDITDFKSEVFIGGPVEHNRIYYMHCKPDLIPKSIPICHGLYWGGDFEILKILISEKQIAPQDIRFFIGYSGWSAGQLQEEVDDKVWLVGMPDIPVIMSCKTEKLWEKTLRKMGGKYKMWSNFPENPNMN